MPRFLHMPRWVGLVTATLTLVVGTLVSGAALAAPASASVLNVCDPNQTFAAPEVPTGVDSNAEFSLGTVTFNNTYNVVTAPSDNGKNSPATQYAGAGLKWYTFGLSNCGDFSAHVTDVVSNLLYNTLVVLPLLALGILLRLAMSTGIGNALLDVAEGPVQAMHQNVFLRWAPAMIAVVLVGGIFMITRGKGRAALGRFGWIIAVIILASGLATPQGLDVVRNTNDLTSNVATCFAFGFTSGCADTGDTNALYTGSMQEALQNPTWGAGALGPIATDEIPDSLDLKAQSAVPNIKQDSTMTIPKNAIPADNPGHPTWAEALRWTQTYTASELAALNGPDGASLRCTGASVSPQTNALTDLSTHSFVSTTSLCDYKWIVRAGMFGWLSENQPGMYETARGANGDRLQASFSSIGILPLALGIMAVGLMTLFYQLELVTLFVASPVVALLALRNPQTGRKWFNQVVSTLVQRLAVGLVLGLVLWMVQIIIGWMSNAKDNPFGAALPVTWRATAEAVLTIVAMIVGFAMLGKVRDLLLETSGVEKDDQRYKRLKDLGTLAVSAGAGALSAGSGQMLAGAAKGMMRGGMSMHRNQLSRGVNAGLAAGRGIKQEQVAAQAHAAKDREEKFMADGKHVYAERLDTVKEAARPIRAAADDVLRKKWHASLTDRRDRLEEELEQVRQQFWALYQQAEAEGNRLATAAGVGPDDTEGRARFVLRAADANGATALDVRRSQIDAELTRLSNTMDGEGGLPTGPIPEELYDELERKVRAANGDVGEFRRLTEEYDLQESEHMAQLARYGAALHDVDAMTPYRQIIDQRKAEEMFRRQATFGPASQHAQFGRVGQDTTKR